MTEHENRDNLEQFFKQNLEGYSPEPASTFWAKVEPAIPIKTPFWKVWMNTAGKIIGAILVSGIILIGIILWSQDRYALQKLTSQVETQKNEIKLLQQKVDEVAKNNKTEKLISKKSPLENKKNKKELNDNLREAYPSNFKNQTLTTETAINIPTESKGNKKNKNSNVEILNNNFLPTNLKTIKNSNSTKWNGSNSSEINPTNLKINSVDIRGNVSLVQSIEPPLINIIPIQKHAPSTKIADNVNQKHLSKFSIEVSSGSFIMPLGSLFPANSLAPQIRPSFRAGLLVNFEVAPNWLLQSGFQFKNIQSKEVDIRYNHFPLLLRRRWATGSKKRLEVYGGPAVNSFINLNNKTELNSISLTNSSFISLESGAAIELPISSSTALIPQANFGYSITPVSNNKRTFHTGISLGIRFKLK